MVSQQATPLSKSSSSSVSPGSAVPFPAFSYKHRFSTKRTNEALLFEGLVHKSVHRSILYRPLLRRRFALMPLPTPSPFSAVPFPFCLVCLAKESQRRRSWRTAATMKTTARRTTRRLKACRYQLACPGVATGRDRRPERLVSYSKRFSISSPASSCPQPRSVVWAGRSPPREPPRCRVISRLHAPVWRYP